jgi:ATP-binding cassette subfamily C protein CydD
LRHADPHSSDEKLTQILVSVDLNVSDLPDGLSTMLGTVRQKLSIGQLRKIALARALLKEAPFIILDEPTASIDDISEARIAELLTEQAKRGAIILVISHRELLISSSSRVTRVGDHL